MYAKLFWCQNGVRFWEGSDLGLEWYCEMPSRLKRGSEWSYLKEFGVMTKTQVRESVLTKLKKGLPWWLRGKESACSARDPC